MTISTMKFDITTLHQGYLPIPTMIGDEITPAAFVDAIGDNYGNYLYSLIQNIAESVKEYMRGSVEMARVVDEELAKTKLWGMYRFAYSNFSSFVDAERACAVAVILMNDLHFLEKVITVSALEREQVTRLIDRSPSILGFSTVDLNNFLSTVRSLLTIFRVASSRGMVLQTLPHIVADIATVAVSYAKSNPVVLKAIPVEYKRIQKLID